MEAPMSDGLHYYRQTETVRVCATLAASLCQRACLLAALETSSASRNRKRAPVVTLESHCAKVARTCVSQAIHRLACEKTAKALCHEACYRAAHPSGNTVAYKVSRSVANTAVHRAAHTTAVARRDYCAHVSRACCDRAAHFASLQQDRALARERERARAMMDSLPGQSPDVDSGMQSVVDQPLSSPQFPAPVFLAVPVPVEDGEDIEMDDRGSETDHEDTEDDEVVLPANNANSAIAAAAPVPAAPVVPPLTQLPAPGPVAHVYASSVITAESADVAGGSSVSPPEQAAAEGPQSPLPVVMLQRLLTPIYAVFGWIFNMFRRHE